MVKTELKDMSMSEIMSMYYEDSELEGYSTDVDLESQEEKSNLDFLSIVLEETDKEDKVRQALANTDDLFGIKEVLLNKKEEISKGKMKNEQLESIIKRNNIANLSQVDFTRQIDFGLLKAGLNRIWEIDGEYQEETLLNFMQDIRKIPGKYLKKYVDRLKSIGAFFNPNDDYMVQVFGSEITQSRYGVYDGDSNRYTMRLMMPLRLFDNSIIGFVGYSPVENEEGRTIKYLYPRKEVFEKSRLLATEVDVFSRAMDEGYICLTDGYFDAFSLNVYGINAASLCGSAVTKYHKLFLRKIKNKIIIPDNDKAGTKLESNIKKLWINSRAIHQTETKDIDEYLLSVENIEKIVKEFFKWKSRGFIGDLFV